MEPRTILIRAVVRSERDGVLTVSLQDGFGRAECVVHASVVVPEK